MKNKYKIIDDYNVSYCKRDNKYVVQLQINGKNKCLLGSFDDVHKAGEFAEKMRKKYSVD